jgi:hypothetical protein
MSSSWSDGVRDGAFWEGSIRRRPLCVNNKGASLHQLEKIFDSEFTESNFFPAPVLGLFESYEKGLVNKTSPGFVLNEVKVDSI